MLRSLFLFDKTFWLYLALFRLCIESLLGKRPESLQLSLEAVIQEVDDLLRYRCLIDSEVKGRLCLF